MERFELESASDLAGNYARYMAEQVWGEEYAAHTEPLVCGSCHQPCPELFPCTWDENLQVGACCVPDPDCSCQTNGDLFDPRGCELHDSESPWNRRLRAVTSVQQWERQVA